MLGSCEKVCDFVESAEKGRKLVKWKLNQVLIGANFCLTSIRLFLYSQKS